MLRLDPQRDRVILTLPRRTSERAALDFAASQAGWIWSAIRRREPPIAFASGALLPLRGIPHLILHEGKGRGGVWTAPGSPPCLVAAGRPEHLERRIGDWLKREAKQELTAASRAYAERMDVRFTRVTVRDTSSRWGSCSAGGALSYSWRLILAPAFVLDYVAAHEVAHLIEMNHSKAFWTLVHRHCARAQEARRWLKASGASLHRYGGSGAAA
ncbi:MAG: M48 family metallopeptidase [Parvibaculaceae bacterium]